MTEQPPLTTEAEEIRQDGLRILARIIARHYLAHPELYEGEGAPGVVAGPQSDARVSEPVGDRANEEGQES